jgi:tRNA pseudouridine13 synthase
MALVSVIKAAPEDFVVEEIAAYEPSGEGDHVFVRFTKRDMTTDAAARAIARGLSADPRSVGIAGNKDKRALTTQVISLAPPRGVAAQDLADQATGLALPGIEVLWAKRHGHKLKTGHLRGNRFAIRVRQLRPDEARAVALRATEIAVTGVPNAFGEQRFGVAGDNASRARDILLGKESPPRDGRLLRLLYSALQSSVFDAVLDERVKRGTWATPLRGDVLKKTDTGGLFVCTDEQQDQPRAVRGDVSPTGPMFGPKMMRAEGEVGALELEIARMHLGDAFDKANAGVLGDGTRRSLRLFVSDCRVSLDDPNYNSVASTKINVEEEVSCLVEFMLPKGAFATTVLSHMLVK